MPTPSSPTAMHNRLLASLPADVTARLLPSLEIRVLPLGEVLYEVGAPLTHVYFPADAIVSLLNVTAAGNSVEVCIVGNDGMVGNSLFMGHARSPTRAVVQIPGQTYRLAARAAMREFERHTEFMDYVLRYTNAKVLQIGQTAACLRHHSVQQRLCRWLLQVLDRHASSDLNVRQELVADMLGVRREAVTIALGNLDRSGVITRYRGHIRVRDRRRLEELSCECYRVIKTDIERLLALRSDAQRSASGGERAATAVDRSPL